MVTQTLQVGISKFTHILHIADIHIRLTKRHDEYLEVFDKLYKAVERTPPTTVVCVLGDVFHNKSDLSPECVGSASDFLKKLADKRTTILIAGNHDATLANKNRMDSLSPIVNAIKHPNLFYLKDTGVYVCGNLLFNNFSVFDEHTPEKYIKYSDIPKIYTNVTDYHIALYHGGVYNAVTDVGFKVTSACVTNESFDGHHIALLGDIHKHQVLQQYDDQAGKPVIVYAGSLIQQNHGENVKGHGFVYWDLSIKAFKHVEIPNNYGFYTVEINKGKISTDISDMPKKARLRLKCFESVVTEVKSALSQLRQSSDVVDVSYLRVDSPTSKSNIIDSTDLNLHNLSDIEYQNKLIGEFVKDKHRDVEESTLLEIEKINKQLNSSLEKEITVKNIRWKPKKFEFDNMFSYGEGNVIDFTKMNNVIGLFASNASGKSSILSALSFCIFDKCDRAFKASHVLNTQKMSFKCKFNFEINKVDYFIERKGIADKKGNVKVDVKFWKEENGKKVELNGEARRSTNDIIRDYVGTYDDFILTVLSIQNNKTGSFIDMGQTERKDLLAQFMGLTVFDKLYNVSSEKTKELAYKLKGFNQNSWDSDLESLSSNMARTESLIVENTQSVDRITSERNVENNNLIEETKKLITINTSTTNITSLEKRAIELQNVIEKQDKELSSHKQSLDKLNGRLTELTLLEHSYLSQDIGRLYDEFQKVKKKCSDVQSLIERKKITVNHKLEKLKTLESHKYDPTCEYCINNVFVKDAIKTKEELSVDKVDVQTLLTEYTSLKNTITAQSSLEEEYDKYQSVVNDKNLAESSVSNLNNAILRLESKLTSDKSSLERIQSQIQEFYDQKDAIELNIQINKNIDTIKLHIKNHDHSIRKLNEELVDLKTKINTWTIQKNQIDGMIKDIKNVELEHKAYQLYSEAVSRDGIQYKIISQALPEIEKEVNNILHQIVEFTVSFETDGKNVSTYIVYDEKKWPLELSSGMEKFVSSLAIRVALINISNLPRPNFIAIDEGFGCADADHLSSMGALFSFLKTNFDFVWIISHLSQMWDMVDSRIEIKKENGTSKVVYI